jgi:RNA polymerase sigma factor (TIGR02999 family)
MAGHITQILKGLGDDRSAASEQLAPLVYAELKKIAASYMRSERPDHTLQPTALVNEAYMRLVGKEGIAFQSRAQFFALAAKIMRGILVDFARARHASKRGSGKKVQLTPELNLAGDGPGMFLCLHEAMDKLKAFDERKAAVVELRYFGGLGFDEIAEALSISAVTARRDSAFGEAWLRRALSQGADEGG